MPINLPDNVTHNNPAYPIVLSEDLGGTTRVITGALNNANLLAISSFKRAKGTILFSETDLKYYTYQGLDTLDANWGNVSNWVIIGGGSVPTLAQVTTAGNQTSNDIHVGLVGSKTYLSRITAYGGPYFSNMTLANYDILVDGAVIYRNLSGGANISPLVNGNTYYVKKVYGMLAAPGSSGLTFGNNQAKLYNNADFTGLITFPLPGAATVPNHFLEQNNRTLTNTIVTSQNFQVDDGLLLVNARQYKTGDVHWISPKNDFFQSWGLAEEGGDLNFNSDQSQLPVTLLVGPYTEISTNPLINSPGTCIIHFDGPRSFIGITNNELNYGILSNLNLKPVGLENNTAAIGGYYSGLGIISMENSTIPTPSFGVLAKNQNGAGRGLVNFTVYNNKAVHTFNNVLDDGSGQVGINCAPSTALHIVQPGTAASAVVRIDSNATSSTTLSSQIQFFRASAGAVINGAVLLGKVSASGLSGSGTYTEGASMEFRSISGAWSTAGNRSAQILFSTRNANTFAERARITQDGKLFINTTTDAGFRLDVNGSFRTTSTINATLANVSTDNVVYYNTTNGLFTYGTAPSGTVTSISAGIGLTGGTITTSGTIALADTSVVAGAYTNANITVDQQGRIIAASNGAAPPSGPSGSFFIPTNPIGQQNFTVTNGIITAIS